MLKSQNSAIFMKCSGPTTFPIAIPHKMDKNMNVFFSWWLQTKTQMMQKLLSPLNKEQNRKHCRRASLLGIEPTLIATVITPFPWQTQRISSKLTFSWQSWQEMPSWFGQRPKNIPPTRMSRRKRHSQMRQIQSSLVKKTYMKAFTTYQSMPLNCLITLFVWP